MKRIILVFLLVVAVFYFVQPPSVHESSAVYTDKLETIEKAEDSLTIEERGKRLFSFPEAVQAAVHRRVDQAHYTPSKNIPQIVKQAIVATEDKRFYEHGSVDFLSVARAFYTNMVAGRTVEGGSTISQQLVKNLFLSSKRVWSRKAEELALAILLEHYYSKDEILTMYLNTIYYGNQYYGIEEASEGYFHVTPKDLSLAQGAMLAGLPQAPTYYNPKVNPEGAVERRRTVLALMLNQGLITKEEAAKAANEPVLPDESP